MSPDRMHLDIRLPDEFADLHPPPCRTPEERMREVVGWAEKNIDLGGGPFAAGVFDLSSGVCVSIGVNRVVESHCSLSHAEILALGLAEQQLKTHDLSSRGRFVLTTSAEPCAQCFGAIPWSGVRAVEFGATREDVEAIGFDEGPKPENWIEALNERNIDVTGPVLRAAGAAVLNRYAAKGGDVYNGGSC